MQKWKRNPITELTNQKPSIDKFAKRKFKKLKKLSTTFIY